MQNPEPPTKWAPARSIYGGALIGTAASQIIVAICNRFINVPIGPELASAITTLCIAVAGYFISDGKDS